MLQLSSCVHRVSVCGSLSEGREVHVEAEFHVSDVDIAVNMLSSSKLGPVAAAGVQLNIFFFFFFFFSSLL
jgi:hypothetical protein